MRFATLIVWVWLASLNAMAREGFAPGAPNRQLENAWQQTVAMITGEGESYQISSAALVARQVVGRFVYLGYLTSGHSLNRMMPALKAGRGWMARNIKWGRTMDPVDVIPSEILFPNVDATKDLGFFIVRLAANRAPEFNPISIASKCNEAVAGEPAILFGFPGVSLRPIALQKEKIMAPNMVVKRSSVGMMTDETGFAEDQRGPRLHLLVGTTADAMEGSSGGPLLNAQGEIIGILIGSLADSRRNPTYQGVESEAHLKAHSFATRCGITKAYASQQWLAFVENLSD